MIVFPPEYSALDLPPGYIWNFKTEQLYSFKYGVIKPLKPCKPWSQSINPERHRYHYAMSVNNRPTYISYTSLLAKAKKYKYKLDIVQVKEKK